MYWDLVIGILAVIGVFLVLVLFLAVVMIFGAYDAVSEGEE